MTYLLILSFCALIIDCGLVNETLLFRPESTSWKFTHGIGIPNWLSHLWRNSQKNVSVRVLSENFTEIVSNYFCENIVFYCFKTDISYKLTWCTCLGPRLLRCWHQSTLHRSSLGCITSPLPPDLQQQCQTEAGHHLYCPGAWWLQQGHEDNRPSIPESSGSPRASSVPNPQAPPGHFFFFGA